MLDSSAGNPEEISIKELAKEILKLTGSVSEIEYKPLPPDDPDQRQPDITMAKEELGWEINNHWYEGIEKTISYFRDVIELHT